MAVIVFKQAKPNLQNLILPYQPNLSQLRALAKFLPFRGPQSIAALSNIFATRNMRRMAMFPIIQK